MKKKRFVFNLLCLAAFLALIAFNQWLFGALWEISYFDWYIENGSQATLAATFATLVWDVNRVTGLVSAQPLHYISAYFHLVGMTLYSFGRQFGNGQKRLVRSSLADILISGILSSSLILLLVSWILLVAPIQYFFTLIVGAPARVMLGSPVKVFARFGWGGVEYREISSLDAETEKTLTDDGWLNTSFSTKAVSFTNAWLALTLLVLKYFLA